MIRRVTVTREATEIINQLQEQHGPLMFHQSGGCCDGSSPMCFEKGELLLDNNDVYLGTIEDSDFHMSRDQFEYWKHTQLTVDVTKGRGAGFSLESPLGVRFIIKSRLFSEKELQQLPSVHFVP